MKKGFLILLVLCLSLLNLWSAGTKVFDLRITGGGGVSFFDTISGTFKGDINASTSDITVDDIVCNTITPDTIVGSLIGAIASLTSSTLITSAKDSTIVLKVMSGMTLSDTIRILDVDTFGTDKTCDTFVNTKIVSGAFAFITWKTQPDSATAVSATCLTDSLFVTVNKTETGGIYQFMIINP